MDVNKPLRGQETEDQTPTASRCHTQRSTMDSDPQGGAQPRRQAQVDESFAGGLLTTLLTPSQHTLEQCLAELQVAGVQAWTEHLPAPADLTVVVAATRSDEAPSMDAIADACRHVLGVLDSAGIDVDVHGSGYVGAAAASA